MTGLLLIAAIALGSGIFQAAWHLAIYLLDGRRAKNFVMPEFAPDVTCLLAYEVQALWLPKEPFTAPLPSEWVPWGRSADAVPRPCPYQLSATGNGTDGRLIAGNAGLVLEWLLTPSTDRLAGIRIRNATGSGDRTARHDVGRIGQSLNKNKNMPTAADYDPENPADMFRRAKDVMDMQRPPESELASKRLAAERVAAINAIVGAVDALILEYEGNHGGDNGR